MIEIATAGGPAASLLANLTAAMMPYLPTDEGEDIDVDVVNIEDLPSEAIVIEGSKPQPSTSSIQSTKSISKKRKICDLEDKFNLAEATHLFPTTSVPASHMGVLEVHISKRIMTGSQGIYKCRFNNANCPVNFQQSSLDRVCTHIRQKHLGVCLACKFCENREGFWSAVGWKEHMESKHCDLKEEWLVPPPLELDVPVKVKSEVSL